MNCAKALLLLLCLIWPPVTQGPQPLSAAASRFQDGRNLAQDVHKSNQKPIQETSPSTAPDPAVAKPKSGEDKVDANPPKTAVDSEEICDRNFNQCRDDVQNITACLLAKAGDAYRGLFLRVHNDGENSFKLNATILPVNSTLEVGDILGHQFKKINVSSTVSRSSAIVLHASNWTCRIGRVAVRVSFPSYMASIKPINGVYLLFGTALLIGILWACCKAGKDERHLNGVPYQELEMGQQECSASTNMETVESWEQNWDDDDDDDWDDEKAVKTAGGNHVGNGKANGVSSRSADTNGWGSDWND